MQAQKKKTQQKGKAKVQYEEVEEGDSEMKEVESED